jgi:hypothetical protein
MVAASHDTPTAVQCSRHVQAVRWDAASLAEQT